MGATRLVQPVGAQDTSSPNGEPTEIRDWHDLDAVRQNLDGDYILVKDLDQTTAGYNEHVGNPAKGWNPIGEVNRNAVEFTSFTGTIDGNGHKITGLQINRPEETDIGLFAMIANRSTTVTNLILTELDVTGREFVGGLVGSNVSGTLTRSRANGEVTGGSFVGGLVGKSSGTVNKSSVHGDVSGEEWIGGLVGWNLEGAVVRDSWFRGEVAGEEGVGGLIGTMTDDGGTLRESWASGNVVSDNKAGGLVGYNKDSEGDPVGGVIASYWNTEVAGQAEAVGNNEGSVTEVTGLSTGEMTGNVARENMAALDFEETWQVVTEPDGYPVLQWQKTTDNVENPPDTEGFNPATHAFGFANWSLSGDFDPPHDHETIAEDTFETQFEEEWLPEIKQHYPLPLPGSITARLVDAHYETLRNGPENLYSDGHCYGMCLVAQQYFEDGVPESLSTDSDTAADIPKPTGDYVDVGGSIDEQHRTQALDFDTVKEAQRLSPASSRNEQPIDAENEVRAIQSAIEETGTALVGIGSSPTSAIEDRFLHQVLAYNIDVEGGESLTDADAVVIDVYDPNDTASYYRDNARSLEVDVSVSSLQPITNGDFGYRSLYHRFALIGPSRTDFKGQIQFGIRLVLDYFSNLLDGFVHIVARSPVRIDAVAPDGERFERPDEAVDGVPRSEHLYLTGATPGDYEIQIEGTDDGEYTLDVLGTVPTGGGLQDSFTGTINEGERQTLTATLPDESGGEGILESSARPDSDDDGVVFGLSRTELATGGLVSVAMVYAAVRMLSNGEDDDSDNRW